MIIPVMAYADFCIFLGLVVSLREVIYRKCGQPIGLWVLVNTLLYFYIRLSVWVHNTKGITRGVKTTFFFLNILGILFECAWNVIGGVWVTWEFKAPESCLNMPIFAISLLIVGVISLFYLYWIVFFITVVRYNRWNYKEDKDSLEELKQLYRQSKDISNEKIDNFLEENRETLEKAGLLEVEKQLIKTQFVLNNCTEKCQICKIDVSEREQGCRIGCPHVFHIECLIIWHRVNPRCIACKATFRRALLKAHNKQIENSNTLKTSKVN